jgi:hypothetical protein
MSYSCSKLSPPIIAMQPPAVILDKNPDEVSEIIFEDENDL